MDDEQLFGGGKWTVSWMTLGRHHLIDGCISVGWWKICGRVDWWLLIVDIGIMDNWLALGRQTMGEWMDECMDNELLYDGGR